jgi:hypothetical protein
MVTWVPSAAKIDAYFASGRAAADDEQRFRYPFDFQDVL